MSDNRMDNFKNTDDQIKNAWNQALTNFTNQLPPPPSPPPSPTSPIEPFQIARIQLNQGFNMTNIAMQQGTNMMTKTITDFTKNALGVTENALSFTSGVIDNVVNTTENVIEEIEEATDNLKQLLNFVSEGKKTFTPPSTKKIVKFKSPFDSEGRSIEVTLPPKKKGNGRNTNFLKLMIKGKIESKEEGTKLGLRSWTDFFPDDIKKEYESYGVLNELDYLILDKLPQVSFENEYDNYLASFFNEVKTGTIGKLLDLLSTANLVANDALTVFSSVGGEDISKRVRSAIKMKALPPGARFTNIYTNIRNWKNTSNLKLGTFTVKFYFGQLGLYNGRLEVWNPVILLTSLFLPELTSNATVLGVTPDAKTFKTAILTGAIDAVAGIAYNSLSSFVGKEQLEKELAAVKKENEENAGNGNNGPITSSPSQEKKPVLNIDTGSISNKAMEALDDLIGRYVAKIKEAYLRWGALYNLRIGRIGHMESDPGKEEILFEFDDFSIKGVKFNFSNELDEYGYPISATVTFEEVESITMAHRLSANSNSTVAPKNFFRLFSQDSKPLYGKKDRFSEVSYNDLNPSNNNSK